MLLTSGTGPWLHIHKRKVFAGEEAIQNETAQHNLVTGGAPDFPPNQPGDLNITVGPNQNANGSSFAVDVDRDGMTLSIQGDAVLDKTACQPGGPGGDRDFTGAKRSGPKMVRRSIYTSFGYIKWTTRPNAHNRLSPRERTGLVRLAR